MHDLDGRGNQPLTRGERHVFDRVRSHGASASCRGERDDRELRALQRSPAERHRRDTRVNGRAIVKSSAERAASASLTKLFGEHAATETKLARIAQYYRDVGLGVLHFDGLGEGRIEQSSSAFVKGWNTAFPEADRVTCTYAEGFLQGAYHAVFGESVTVRETACMHAGAPRCRFEISKAERPEIQPVRMLDERTYRAARMEQRAAAEAGARHVTSPTVDNAMITGGVLAHMPLVGNDQGLCPVFIQADGLPGAHLSSVPMDFYALLFTSYADEMGKQGRREEARVRLIGAAEACSYYTWGKVLSSQEWAGMINPMVQNTGDRVFGLLALANMLGRGKWSVVGFEPGARLEVESFNNYEGESYERLAYQPQSCSCTTLSGTATAHMNLVYPSHELIADGIGDFKTTEVSCIARGDDRCRFVCERRALTPAEIQAQHAPEGLSCAIG